jgi:hypothetical protein
MIAAARQRSGDDRVPNAVIGASSLRERAPAALL